MKKLTLVFAFALASIFAFSGPPWERVNYRNSTIFTGIITIDGNKAKEGDIVGAFVGKECRMIAKVFYHNDSTFVSSVIHGEMVEDITFKLWVEADKKEYELKQPMKSAPGESIYLYKLPFTKK